MYCLETPKPPLRIWYRGISEMILSNTQLPLTSPSAVPPRSSTKQHASAQHPTTRYATHIPVHLARRAAEDEGADGVAGHLDGGEGAEDVDARVGEDDAGARGVLDRVARLAVLAGDAADGTREVVAVQRLDVLDLRERGLALQQYRGEGPASKVSM
jgi:hypothetical protein